VKKIFCLPLLLVAIRLFAQGNNNNALAFPSPNNTFLAKVTSPATVGVDLYTGMATVHVPICELASKKLSIPISLNYVDGRGVKVQEYASQVGLGWQLNAGGCITRVVRGFPDEQPNGYLGTGTQPAGVLSPGQNWGSIATSYAKTFCQNCTTAQEAALDGGNPAPPYVDADGEPDLFYVKTPFFSFEFVFDPNGQPVMENASGYKIITTNFINTPLPTCNSSSFEVIDDQGNQYYFGFSPTSTEESTDTLYNVPTTFVSTWYLNKIVTFNSEESITLNYQAAPTNDVLYNYSWVETRPQTLTPTVMFESTGQNIISTPLYVSSIVSSLGEVDFSYGVRTRQDDNNAEILNSIVLKAYNPSTGSNSTTLQTFNFNYSYFGLPSTDPNVLRLELLGVTVAGNTSSTSTPQTLASFTYNTSVNLPNRTWLAYDYWGYCSSTTNAADVFSMPLNTNTATVAADVLTNVYTMEGGMWQINYESNMYGGTPVDGLCVSSVQQVLPTGTQTTSYTYVNANGVGTGEIISGNYTPNQYQIGTYTIAFTSSPFTINDVNGTFVGYSQVQEKHPNGGTTYYTFTNFNDPVDIDTIGFDDAMTLTWSGTTLSQMSAGYDLSAKRGLLTSQMEKTASGNEISYTTYVYNPVTHSFGDAYGFRVLTFNVNGVPARGTLVYYVPIENYRLTQVVQQTFDQLNPTASTNPPVTVTTNYTYDPQNNRLLQTASTTDSKGQSEVQIVYRSEDMSYISGSGYTLTSGETSAINTMLSDNKTSAVIHTIDTRNIHTTSVVHNTYGILQNGLAQNVYLGNSAKYMMDAANNNTLTQQQFFVFDPATSNLFSTNPLGGTSTSAMYLYKTYLPVAKVVNATTSEFFYQGFEEGGGNYTTEVHTGNTAYNGSYSVPFTLPDGRSYLIQWWSYSGSWMFNQQAYTGPMNLSGVIDDVRVFPKDALMTTCTYNPQVGKTAEIDPSGKTLTYQYDGLNRIQTVLDQDNNVLKTYNYAVQYSPSLGSTTLSLTGVPGYSSSGPTTGSGLIYGPVGYVVTVTMYAMGSPSCGLNVQINGVTSNGPTSVTNGTASFTFVMPVAGQVSWSASLVPSGPGGGDFSIK
jgi:YD repeat-containing protein